MYKINIVAVGTLKESFFKSAQDEYIKRLGRFCSVNVVEIKECVQSGISTADLLDKEMMLIEPYLKGKVMVLAVEGEMLSSEAFADKMFDTFTSHDTITFVIGSSYGLSEKLKAKHYKLSFSKMTFPHHLMRIFLEEQIYRAFTIKQNITYHK